jgi:hypothetical protein
MRNTILCAQLGSALLFMGLVAGCTQPPIESASALAPTAELDAIASDYLRLTLAMGELEPGYVDAYYGPAELAAAAKSKPITLAEAGQDITALSSRLKQMDTRRLSPLANRRAAFLTAQVKAAETRHAMLSGQKISFRDESLGLFAATPDLKPLSAYDPVLLEIDRLVPGEGELSARVDAFQNRYTIPKDRLKAVFDEAIAECKRRTAKFIQLPAEESFSLEFVTGKSWSGYNYYQGNYKSLIQINTDLPIRISRAVDLGCHEGYPGHHAYSLLLEQNLSRGLGWQEFTVYPLYSPQSLIAEGTANYGIELAFSRPERIAYETKVLYPIAGLDPTGAEAFQKMSDALSKLAGSRFSIAKAYLDGEMTKEQAIAATQKYGLVSRKRAEQSISFTETYRSYVINYGLGQDMARAYVEAGSPNEAEKWRRMEKLLSEPTLPSDLIAKP